MPLLKKEIFIKSEAPPNLKPDDEVYHCTITNEIFTDYEKFFERIILCNSLIWSCSYTGRTGLTYQEALKSEENIKQQLAVFPDALKKPILFLVMLTHRRSINDVVDDVFGYVKDRFFAGETVEAHADGNNKKLYKVMKVMLVKENGNLNYEMNSSKGSPCKFSANSNAATFSPNKSISSTNKVVSSPNNSEVQDKYEYALQEISKQITSVRVLTGSKLLRKKGSFTREKCKVFIRANCKVHPPENIWKVKDEAVRKYKLLTTAFESFSAGPIPKFDVKEAKKNVVKQNGDVIDLTSDEMSPKKAKKGSNMSSNSDEKDKETNRLNNAKLQAKKDMEKVEEELKNMRELAAKRKEEVNKKKEESKKKLMAEKEKKDEVKKKEVAKKMTEMQSKAEWSKPRDDLECDDLKDLPTSVPIKMEMLVSKDFGDVLYVMEFIKSFHQVLGLDINKSFTLEKLYECLGKSDLDGWYSKLVVSITSSLFSLQKSEVDFKVLEDKKNSDLEDATDISNVLKAARTAQVTYGCIIQDLPIDAFSISEVLRMYFSTMHSSQVDAQSSSSSSSSINSFVELLKTNNIFKFSPDHKLEVLTQLINQLLNTTTVRNEVEARQEDLKLATKQLRMHQFNCLKRSRDEASFWMKKKQEDVMKGMLSTEKSSTDIHVNNDNNAEVVKNNVKALNGKLSTNTDKAENLTSFFSRKSSRTNSNIMSEQSLENLPTENLDWSKISEAEKMQIKDWEQRKEKKLLDEIKQLRMGSPVVLGFDRTHRRYWMVTCTGGILVEDELDISQGLSRSNSSPTKLRVVNQQKKITTMVAKKSGDDDDINNKSEEEERSDKENVPTDDNEAVSSSSSLPSSNKCSMMSVQEQLATKGQIKWSLYHTVEQINVLLSSLNSRGFRESKLLQSIKDHRAMILDGLPSALSMIQFINDNHQPKSCSPSNNNICPGSTTSVVPQVVQEGHTEDEAMKDYLIESLIDLEDRIYAGALGKLKEMDRDMWKKCLEEGRYDDIINMSDVNFDVNNNNDDDDDIACMKDVMENNQCTKTNNKTSQPLASSSAPPTTTSTTLKGLIVALIQIERMVETRFIDVNLGHPDKKSKNKQNKKKKETEAMDSDDDASSTSSHQHHHQQQQQLSHYRSNQIYAWESSLKSSTNMSQVYLHMHILESSVTWSKSALNARCRICRKKGDGERMILCDSCDKGHHIYCLKPPVKEIPEGDWFCPWCCPPPVLETPRKKSSVEQEESEDDEEEEDGDDDEDEEDANDEDEEHDDDDDQNSEASDNENEESSKDNDEDDDKEEEEDNDDDGGTDEDDKEDCNYSAKLESSNKYFYNKKIMRQTRSTELSSTKNASKSSTKGNGKRLSLNKDTIIKRPSIKKYFSASTIIDQKGRCMRTRQQINKMNYAEEDDEVEDDDLTDNMLKKKRCLNDRKDRKGKDKSSTPPDTLKRQHSSRILNRSNSSNNNSNVKSTTSPSCDPMKFCEDLISRLMAEKDVWPFLRPVSKKEAPDYLDVIKKPMDFSTIRNKIHSFQYGHHDEIIADVRLIFDNCKRYNKKSSFFYTASEKLSNYFENQLKELQSSRTDAPTCKNNLNKSNKRKRLDYDDDDDANDEEDELIKSRPTRRKH